MSDFRKAFLWTALPFVVVGIVSAVASILQRFSPLGFPVLGVQILTLLAALVLFIVALGMAIRALIRGKKGEAAGILAGLGIGLVAYFASCFAGFLGALVTN
ncbi:MAG: hypothetical protein HYX84_08050 [Chloroflexi bacterium]|nr:hypothetical protein [Chloroflexota bacterium]